MAIGSCQLIISCITGILLHMILHHRSNYVINNIINHVNGTAVHIQYDIESVIFILMYQFFLSFPTRYAFPISLVTHNKQRLIIAAYFICYCDSLYWNLFSLFAALITYCTGCLTC